MAWQGVLFISHRPSSSFSQPPARKIQKIDSGGSGLGVDKPSKKQKQSKLALSSSSSSLDTKMGKEPGKHQQQPQQQQDTSLLKLKTEGPDRFWSTVEPYCADITQADIDMLEDGIRSVS